MGRISFIRRTSALSIAAIVAGFGLTGIASAQTITNTGPNSTNRIDTKITDKCKIENDNKVDVKNSNDQKATTGDATVGGSGHSSGHDWSDGSDPAIVQASSTDGNTDGVTPTIDPLTQQTDGPGLGSLSGGTPSFLDGISGNSDGNWSKNHDGGNTFGGDATTGDATNNNSTDLTINIDNSADNPCVQNNINVKRHAFPSRITTKSNAFKNAAIRVTPGAPGAPGFGAGRGAGGFGAGVPSISKKSAPAAISTAEAVTPGRGAGPAAVAAVQKSAISTTGPQSSNKISTTVNNNVTVKNDNNICITNTNTQKASTGDASVKGNTSGGDAGTGDGSNGNATGPAVDISN